MSMLLNQAPRFSSGPALIRHYKAVRMRMANLAPPPLIALPSPEMMAKGNLLPFVMTKPAPIEKPKVFPVGEMALVEDLIPDQRDASLRNIERLAATSIRVAIRRTVAAYRSAIQADPTGRRLAMVKRAASDSFKIDLAAMTSRAKTAGVVEIRQIAICLARRLTDASTTEIGRAFGGRDHSTVCYAITKLKPVVDSVIYEMYYGGRQ